MSNKNFSSLFPTCTKALFVVLIVLWCTAVMGLNAAEDNFVNLRIKGIKQEKQDKPNKGKAGPFKGYQRYQTFNEFKMRGEGKPLRKPFVYVKRTANRINVIASDNTTFPKYYVRTKGNVWYQHLELEMYKINMPITKSGPDWPARTYDRVFYNDTILEYYCSYMGETKFKTFYIKTRKTCVAIVLIHEIDFVDSSKIIPNMIKMAELYTYHKDILLKQRGRAKFDKRNIEYYEIKTKPNSYIYYNVEDKDYLVFNRNSLGLWGIQPGIEKYDGWNSTRWRY